MFKLVALLFLVVNGVQAEKPSGALRNNETFATKEACEHFFDGEKGALAKKAIDDMLASQEMRIAAQFVCVKDESKDNSI